MCKNEKGLLVALGALVAAGTVLALASRPTAEEATAQELLRAALKQAARALGVTAPSLVFVAGIKNARSTGTRIEADAAWFAEKTVGLTRIDAAAVALAVMGHELGHHVHGDAWRLIRPPAELRRAAELAAERVAGFVLARSGHALDAPVAMVYRLTGGRCTPEYGCPSDRAWAMAVGHAAAYAGG
jgi:hypothetical protein